MTHLLFADEVHADLRHCAIAVRLERLDQHHTDFFRQRHMRDEVTDTVIHGESPVLIGIKRAVAVGILEPSV